ncbi:MAG: sarcosine oxidase subunit gamma family protein [Pseudomonadota bacterium]|jgi:sarcosine oxidase subunit gamma
MSNLTRRSPRIDATPWLEALPAMTRLSFRGGPDASAAAARGFGVALPTAACRANAVGPRAALWMGPDEHLLLAPLADSAALRVALAEALGQTPHSIVDIGHRQVAFLVKGPQAEWLLGTGCPLDLDLGAFPVGMCTRTVYMKSEIYLWRTAADVFHLETWRSFTPYVVDMLIDAAQELVA